MYIFIEIVEPQLVGDSINKLLRVVNINAYYNNMKVFESPNYVPFHRKQFSQVLIGFQLLLYQGLFVLNSIFHVVRK